MKATKHDKLRRKNLIRKGFTTKVIVDYVNRNQHSPMLIDDILFFIKIRKHPIRLESLKLVNVQEHIEYIKDPESWTANMAFPGIEKRSPVSLLVMSQSVMLSQIRRKSKPTSGINYQKILTKSKAKVCHFTTEELVAFVNEHRDSPDILGDIDYVIKLNNFDDDLINKFSISQVKEYIKDVWKPDKSLFPDIDYYLDTLPPLEMLLLLHLLR